MLLFLAFGHLFLLIAISSGSFSLHSEDRLAKSRTESSFTGKKCFLCDETKLNNTC